MQKIAPHTLPPNAKSEGTRKISENAAQPVPASMQLARRIRREQGVEQVRRFLIAMEPFLAPYERMAIAEHMGIRLPPSQSSSGGQTGNQTRPMNQPNSSGFSQGNAHQGRAQAAYGAPGSGNFTNNGPTNNGPMNNGPMNNGPMNNGPMNNGPMNNGSMNPQMQMLNMLSQMGNSTQAGLNPMMLAQMMGNLGMGNFKR